MVWGTKLFSLPYTHRFRLHTKSQRSPGQVSMRTALLGQEPQRVPPAEPSTRQPSLQTRL